MPRALSKRLELESGWWHNIVWLSTTAVAAGGRHLQIVCCGLIGHTCQTMPFSLCESCCGCCLLRVPPQAPSVFEHGAMRSSMGNGCAVVRVNFGAFYCTACDNHKITHMRQRTALPINNSGLPRERNACASGVRFQLFCVRLCQRRVVHAYINRQ